MTEALGCRSVHYLLRKCAHRERNSTYHLKAHRISNNMVLKLLAQMNGERGGGGGGGGRGWTRPLVPQIH